MSLFTRDSGVISLHLGMKWVRENGFAVGLGLCITNVSTLPTLVVQWTKCWALVLGGAMASLLNSGKVIIKTVLRQ